MKIPKVFHILGGQVVIGNLTRIEDLSGLEACMYVEDAHEIMATPSESSLRGSISFVPFGSIFGVLPALVPQELILRTAQLTALPMDPPERLKEEFYKATTRLDEERERIAAVLKASQTDITKDGTL